MIRWFVILFVAFGAVCLGGASAHEHAGRSASPITGSATAAGPSDLVVGIEEAVVTASSLLCKEAMSDPCCGHSLAASCGDCVGASALLDTHEDRSSSLCPRSPLTISASRLPRDRRPPPPTPPPRA